MATREFLQIDVWASRLETDDSAPRRLEEIMLKLTLMSATIATLIAVSPGASAQKLYKVIDDKGKVSYQDKPPVEEAAGEVVEKHIDRNVMKLRENAPKDGAVTFEDVEEPDPYTYQEEVHSGGVAGQEEGELGTDSLDHGNMAEVPAAYRESAQQERELSAQPYDDNPAVARPKKSVKKKKKKTLSADELNDIARNAGN